MIIRIILGVALRPDDVIEVSRTLAVALHGCSGSQLVEPIATQSRVSAACRVGQLQIEHDGSRAGASFTPLAEFLGGEG